MSAPTHAAAGDFVTRFREFWASPHPERLHTLLSEDAVLVAPLMPSTRSLADAAAAWADLLALIPDLTNDIVRWAPSSDGVFIEFTLTGTVAGTQMSWSAVDRFVLGDDGLATERVSYYDSGPLMAALTQAG